MDVGEETGVYVGRREQVRQTVSDCTRLYQVVLDCVRLYRIVSKRNKLYLHIPKV